MSFCYNAVLLVAVCTVSDVHMSFVSGVGQPRLVIPWVVLQELDTLKDNRGNRVVSDRSLHVAANLSNTIVKLVIIITHTAKVIGNA